MSLFFITRIEITHVKLPSNKLSLVFHREKPQCEYMMILGQPYLTYDNI